MMISQDRPRQRRGAWTVEAAFMVPIFLLFMLGILEYARFMMTVQLLNDAAREGARYTVVNTTSTLTTAQIQTYVDQYLAGQGPNQIQNYNPTVNIKVFQADPVTGLDNGQGWQNAGTGKPIGVQISGTFSSLVGSISVPFLKLQIPILGTAVPIQATCIMYSEAN